MYPVDSSFTLGFCIINVLQVYECEMAMTKVDYCGISLWSNRTGETVYNSLCIEFHSDDRSDLLNYDYLGFIITYYQRKGDHYNNMPK